MNSVSTTEEVELVAKRMVLILRESEGNRPMRSQGSTSPRPCIIDNPSTSLHDCRIAYMCSANIQHPTSNLHASRHQRHCMNLMRQLEMGNLVQTGYSNCTANETDGG